MNTQQLLARYYYSQSNFVDGTTEFHNRCATHIKRGSRILEIGPGPPNQTTRFLASLGPVTGADISPEIATNTWLTSAVTCEEATLPFEACAFDACVSNYVVEHIRFPLHHLSEVQRVLRPGGVYCFRTPNLFHYVSLTSRALPHSLHRTLSPRLRNLDRAHEPYETFYRLNTAKAIKRFSKTARLSLVELVYIEKEPSYGMAHPLLFYSMMCYERLVNYGDLLQRCRSNIQCIVQKVAHSR